MSILPASRKSTCRLTEMKKFDQSKFKRRSAVFENKRMDTIRTVCLLRLKARETVESIITRNLNIRQNIVSDCIEGGIIPESCKVELGTKVSVEFSFRSRRDGES